MTMTQHNQSTSRAWLEVDFDALARNLDSANALLHGAQLIPVLKNNAYGMGAVALARYLKGRGVPLVAVAAASEGIELTASVPGIDVLVMGPVIAADIEPAIRAGVVIALFSWAQAEDISRASTTIGIAARVHIKINTGLNRIGFDDAETAVRAAQLPGIAPEGLFTHLALRDTASDHAQLCALDAARSAFADAGIAIPMVHALDSIGMVRYPESIMSGARLGAWLYGVRPSGYQGPAHCEMICTFKARIAQIRELPEGSLVGYDEDHPLPRPSTIATVTAGYGDGYLRLSSKGYALVHGQRAPIAGLVSMDQLSLDITGIADVHEGDAVTLLGDGISIDEYASWINLNRNDALSRISRRVNRIYNGGIL